MVQSSGTQPNPAIVSITTKRPRPADAPARSAAARSSRPSRPSKRYRRFAAPASHDFSNTRISTAVHLAEHAASGSTYLSSRVMPPAAPPSLINCCLRKAAIVVVHLAMEIVQAGQQRALQGVAISKGKQRQGPPPLVLQPGQRLEVLDDVPPMLMARLGPVAMHQAADTVVDEKLLPFVIMLLLNTFLQPSSTAQFRLPPALSASYSLPAELLRTLAKCEHLTHLDLTAQAKITDAQMKGVLSRLPHLKSLKLKGCTSVGDGAVSALSASPCVAQLESLNLNYTATTTKSLVVLLPAASNLRTLKLASLEKFTDPAVVEMMSTVLSEADRLPLGELRSLKVKRTAISDAGLRSVLQNTPHLESLDVSWTKVTSFLAPFTECLPLEQLKKLVLSGLSLRTGSVKSVLEAVSRGGQLEVLKLGSLGEGLSRASFNAEVLGPDMLRAITPSLEKCGQLKKLSLFGNGRAGNHSRALHDFLAAVGRRCVTLDLTNVVQAGMDAHLTDDALSGLVWDDETINLVCPAIKHLNLDGTRVKDEVAWMIAACSQLESLHLSNSRITEEGLKEILLGCPKLATLDLSGCRGVGMQWRRNAFGLLKEMEMS